MSHLSASPFHPQTGRLLPVYRDAYLVGDLATSSAQAVNTYLRTHPEEAAVAAQQWQALQAAGEVPAAAPLPWAEPRAAAVGAAPRRWRLPALRLFGLIVGTGLLGLTAYGLTLVRQQQHMNEAGPVFQRTEQHMETASVTGSRAQLSAVQ